MKPLLQEQIGLWLFTWHTAFSPQAPGQGSTHFWLTHALFKGHSELTTHSGRQAGGDPTNVATQEHTAWPFTSLHWLFGPQGEGTHGFLYITAKRECYQKPTEYNLKKAYVHPFEEYSRSKDFHCNPKCKDKMEGDWLLDIRHSGHNYLHKDFDICCVCTLYLTDNQNLIHIQVDNLRMGCRNILVCIDMSLHHFALCNLHSNHKVMVHKDLRYHTRQAFAESYTEKMDHQYTQQCRHTAVNGSQHGIQHFDHKLQDKGPCIYC